MKINRRTFVTGTVVISLLKVAGVFIVAQLLEGTVISPRIVGDSVGLHPVWIVLALALDDIPLWSVSTPRARSRSPAAIGLHTYCYLSKCSNDLTHVSRRLMCSANRPGPLVHWYLNYWLECSLRLSCICACCCCFFAHCSLSFIFSCCSFNLNSSSFAFCSFCCANF